MEFRSQFEIRTVIFLNTLDYGTLINKEIESIYKTISTFFVEIHLDVVREVLLIVRLDFFSTKLVDITGRFTDKIRMIDLEMAKIFSFSTIEEKNEF